MKKVQIFSLFVCTLLFSAAVWAQSANSATFVDNVSGDHRLSPAYKTLYLHLEEVSSQLKQFRTQYTENFPIVTNKKFEYDLTKLEMAKMLARDESDILFLTVDYGNLLIRKITAEMELREMLTRFTLNHPGIAVKSGELQSIEKEILLYNSNH